MNVFAGYRSCQQWSMSRLDYSPVEGLKWFYLGKGGAKRSHSKVEPLQAWNMAIEPGVLVMNSRTRSVDDFSERVEQAKNRFFPLRVFL